MITIMAEDFRYKSISKKAGCLALYQAAGKERRCPWMCDPIAEYAKEFYWPEVLAEKHRADLAEKKAIDFEERMLLAEQKSEETAMAANAEAAKAKETARESAQIIEDCALSFLQSGFSLEETAAKTRLSMEKVQEIAAKVTDQI